VSAVASGASRRAAATRFEVSASSAIKLMQHVARTGDHAPGKRGGGRTRKLAGHEDWLHAVMAAEPDITLAELKARLAAEKAIAISQQAINTTLRALGYSYIKNRARGRTGPARRRG
jgi:transposase